MTSFELLVIAHLIGDWTLQTEYMAKQKFTGKFINWALISHCLVYSSVFIPVFVMQDIHPAWILLIFGSHLFIDRRWPVTWWIRSVMHTSEETIKSLWWLTIMVDQTAHTLILVIVAIVHSL